MLWAVVLAAWLAQAACFNVLPHGAVVFSPKNGRKADHFGYNVAIARSQGRLWVVVASPRAASVWEKSNYVNPGALYLCTTARDTEAPMCEQIHLEQGRNEEKGMEDVMHVSNGTLGSSMDAVPSNEGLLVCNSAFKDLLGQLRLNMPGRCFWLEDFDKGNSNVYNIIHSYSELKEIVVDGKVYRDDIGTQLMGFSVHKLENDKLLVGSPGYFWGRGAVAQLEVNSDRKSWGVAIPLLRNDSYFGYSVTAGKFIPDADRVFVSGAPRGDVDDLKGKAVIFTFQSEGLNPVKILKVLNGTQIGEYFGSALCAVDLNGDGLDDLLVGAPLHASALADEGRVYIFMSTGKPDIVTVTDLGVSGNNEIGARFGTAISSIGDINKDGYQDVAVGAPYEEGARGAVYIYYGGKDAPHLLRPQRIAASAVDGTLRGFGFSLSRGADVDVNNYNDIAVGAYLSDNAVLLRTSPILYLNSSVSVKGEKIPMDATEAVISVCISHKELLKDVGLEVTVNVDSIQSRASLAKGTKKYILNMTKGGGNQYCSEHQLLIQSQKKTYKPLDIELSFEIKYPVQGKTFCHMCPLLDPENKKAAHRVYFETGCSGHVCKTNFTTKAEFEGIRSPFTIGNISSINMSLEVMNMEESSFATNVSITFTSLVPLRQVDKACQRVEGKNNNLLCEVPYVMKRDSQPFKVRLSFDMDRVPWNIQQLMVNITVEGDGDELTPEDDNISLLLDLKHIANVYIKGRSIPESSDIYTKLDNSDDFIYQDKSFKHIYTLTNEGPSPIHGVELQFLFPTTLKTGSSDITYLQVDRMDVEEVRIEVYKNEMLNDIPAQDENEESTYLLMDCKYSNIECKSFSYTYQKFLKKNEALSFPFNITGLFKSQGQFLDKGGVLVKSTGSIKNDYLNDQDEDFAYQALSASVQTELHGNIPKGEVASWIIVVAVICGLLILVILTIIMWKTGFFKRKMPPKEEEEDNDTNEKPSSSEKVDTDPLCEDNA